MSKHHHTERDTQLRRSLGTNMSKELRLTSDRALTSLKPPGQMARKAQESARKSIQDNPGSEKSTGNFVKKSGAEGRGTPPHTHIEKPPHMDAHSEGPATVRSLKTHITRDPAAAEVPVIFI